MPAKHQACCRWWSAASAVICSGISNVPQLTLGTAVPHLGRLLGRIATFKIPNVYGPWDGWDGWDGFPAVGGCHPSSPIWAPLTSAVKPPSKLVKASQTWSKAACPDTLGVKVKKGGTASLDGLSRSKVRLRGRRRPAQSRLHLPCGPQRLDKAKQG